MSDPLIQSQLQNPLLYSLRESYTSNLSYNHSENYPAISKSIVAIASNIGVSPGSAWPGQEIVFNIPKNGFMDNLVIQTRFNSISTTASSAAMVHAHPGEHIFERIELLAQNRVIAVQTYGSLKAHIAGLKYSEAAATRVRTMAKDTNGDPFTFSGTSKACITYTPFFSAMLRSLRQAIDLTKVQDLQLRCFLKPTNNIVTGGGTTLSDFRFTLFMNSHVMDQEQYIKLRQQNFKENGVLSVISYDYMEEQFTVSGNDPHHLQLRCNGSVAETSVFVQNSDSVALSKVSEVSFRANGQTLLESLPQDIIAYEADMCGSTEPLSRTVQTGSTVTATAPTSGSSIVTRIPWGLVPGSMYNSGLINFKGLSNPTLVVKAPAGTTKVIVVHKVFTVVTISSDGSLSLTSTV